MTEMRRAEIGRLCVPDPYRRDRAVKPAGQKPGSDARYDFKTLVYGAIRLGRDVVMVAPKLMNFKHLVRKCSFSVDGVPAKSPRIKTYYRHALLRLADAPEGTHLTVTFPNGANEACLIETPDTDFLAGLNVQMTISKDNDLNWVREQLTFHAAKSGVEAVCFIDNGSTAYTLDDLADTLADCGLKRAVLVSAPLKWGATNIKPVSRELYLQTSVYNIVKYRFLSRARAVLCCDVDEVLVPSEPGDSVFDRAVGARLGFVRFEGMNRFPAALDDAPFSFPQHYWQKPDMGPAASNWCLDPTGPLGDFQWRCHNLESNLLGRFQMLKTPQFYHCLGIGTGWKHEERMRSDAALVENAEDRAFWETVFVPNVRPARR